MPVEEFDVDLTPGTEWHSAAIRLRRGEVVTLTCTSPKRFYAGLFSREEYAKRKGAASGAFDFLPGSDRRAFTTRAEVEQTEDYYIVLRVSVFNFNQQIHVRFVRERPAAGA